MTKEFTRVASQHGRVWNACTFLLLFVLSVACVCALSVSAQPASSGGFDIAKVREAVDGKADPQTGKAELPRTPSITAALVRMVLSLAVILFLVAAVFYGLRRFAFRNRLTSRGSGMLDVLETTGILPGKTLALVRVSDRVLLLGLSQDSVRCLCEFEGAKALEIIQASDKGNMPKIMTQFSDQLNSFLGRFKGKGE